jgi:hypothetical protein
MIVIRSMIMNGSENGWGIAATLVGLMTGAVAGTFFTGSSILLGK